MSAAVSALARRLLTPSTETEAAILMCELFEFPAGAKFQFLDLNVDVKRLLEQCWDHEKRAENASLLIPLKKKGLINCFVPMSGDRLIAGKLR